MREIAIRGFINEKFNTTFGKGLNTRELFIKIDDPTNQTQDEWTLNVHACRATGANKPVFIAANVDLTTRH
ncbi:MAG: hypothetical protein B7Y05_13805 [Polynucleobacter sp. 24-46-87]|nr:MAG: hypothetical protein B7Y05_13805 [Polynucleobacter sp. 24-46-87]